MKVCRNRNLHEVRSGYASMPQEEVSLSAAKKDNSLIVNNKACVFSLLLSAPGFL